MIVVYDKNTHEIFGYATSIFDNGSWREYTLDELYPKLDKSKYGFFYMKDNIKYATQPSSYWRVKVNEKGEGYDLERVPNPNRIALTTKSPDADGDGMPELKADGKSTAVIDIQVYDGDGKKNKGVFDIKVSTTGGRLSNRMIKTSKDGTAKVELQSTQETVTLTVTATAEGMTPGQLTFELMP